MVKLEKSEVLGRLTRKDDVSEQGITTWTLIREAIRDKRQNEAIDLLSFLQKECSIDQVGFINKSLIYIAKNHGEEEVAKALKWWRGILQKAGDVIYSMSLEELIQYQCEEMRASVSLNLGGRDCFTVSEEKKRFVVSVDPTHMTRLRRTIKNEPARMLGVTQRPHPWSWGRAGVPYYCARCCLWWEIMPIQDRGYPVRVHEYPENLHDPCRIIYYKEPESIPRRYFSRVGMEKDPTKFDELVKSPNVSP